MSTPGTPGQGRRILTIVLTVLLAGGIAIGIAFAAGLGGGGKKVVSVSGLSGSEKIPFFEDERVVNRLKDLGFDVQVEPAGSREIATNYDLSKYDFAFPAGVPAAEKIRRQVKTPAPYTTFFTPMAIASFRPIVDMLI